VQLNIQIKHPHLSQHNPTTQINYCISLGPIEEEDQLKEIKEENEMDPFSKK